MGVGWPWGSRSDSVPGMHVRSRTYMMQQFGAGDDLLTLPAGLVIWRDHSWRVTRDALLISPLPTKRRLRRSSAGPPLRYIPFSANVDTYLFEHYSLQIKATFYCTIDIVLLSFHYHLNILRVCICKYEIKDNFILTMNFEQDRSRKIVWIQH